jgi:hypothetical protein
VKKSATVNAEQKPQPETLKRDVASAGDDRREIGLFGSFIGYIEIYSSRAIQIVDNVVNHESDLHTKPTP